MHGLRVDIISTLAPSLNQTHTKPMTKTRITERRARQGSTTLYKEGIGVKRIAKSLQGKGAVVSFYGVNGSTVS